MGIFGDIFGFGSDPTPVKPSGGILDGLFSGTPEPIAPPSKPFGYREPILPAASQARGYGGQMFGSVSEADKSCLMDGIVKDPDTGYVDTPANIYDRYVNEGRDPTRLVQRYRKR